MSKKKLCAPQGRYAVSQNFLTSARTIERLLAVSNITRADEVWEIGAGKGHITRPLQKRCGQLTAVEIDPALCRALGEKMRGADNLRLVQGDFLRMRLPPARPYKVFANIPFCRTSDILRKLTTAPNPPAECWLVMEKGAAKRFLGLPRETVSSLTLKPYFSMRIAYHLRREDFHPAPSVDAVLVHLHRKETPDLPVGQRERLRHFVRQMAPCLAGQGRGPMTRRQANLALRSAGKAEIPPSATLSYVQWLCLFRWWAHLPRQEVCRKS